MTKRVGDQVKNSIFAGPAAAAIKAVTGYVPESIRDFHHEVEALAPALQQISAAVRTLRASGQGELPLDRTVIAHLDQVAVELDRAVAVAAEGGPLLTQLHAEWRAQEREGEAA
jgi:hypothetical protein